MTAPAVVAAAGGPFGFSRALPPETKRALAATGLGVEMPAIAGRTVVPDDWDRPVVLGHPNYFGRFEPSPPARPIILIAGTWFALHPAPGGAHVVEQAPAIPEATATALLHEARRLAKRLTQHVGVQVPFTPEAPIVVVLLSRTVDPDAAREAGATLLSADYPEMPGGIRIELPAEPAIAGGVGYAERLERLVTEGT